MSQMMRNENFEISAKTIKQSLILNYVIAVIGLTALLYLTYDMLLSKDSTWINHHIETFTDEQQSMLIGDVLSDKKVIYWFSDEHLLTSDFELYTLILYHGKYLVYLNGTLSTKLLMLLLTTLFVLTTVGIAMFFNYKKIHKTLVSADLKHANIYKTVYSLRTLNVIAENISHETTTPIASISSANTHSKSLLEDFLITNKNINDRQLLDLINGLLENTNILDVQISALSGVLEKMSSFKEIKHSNGDKSIYDILHATYIPYKRFTMPGNTQDFECNIDEQFKKYKSNGLRNEEIYVIFTNLLKNSLTAHSTKIEIKINERVDGKLFISFTDNGHGVVADLKDKLFKLNTTTKNNGGGYGLFAIKETLLESGCDITLDKTSSNGTVFKLTIPILTKD